MERDHSEERLPEGSDAQAGFEGWVRDVGEREEEPGCARTPSEGKSAEF